MDAPEYMRLTPEQESLGMRVYRFLDQIVVVDKQGRAVRRAFFPSRNAAKRANHHFLRLRRLAVNPRNGENCQNFMVPEAAPLKPTKGFEKLQVRIRDYENTVSKLKAPEGAFTKPGSMKE